MNWKKAGKDHLPGHYEKVLISVNGIYYIAQFDSSSGAFVVELDEKKYFRYSDHQIYWTEFIN
jgi:hypothetical protein